MSTQHKPGTTATPDTNTSTDTGADTNVGADRAGASASETMSQTEVREVKTRARIPDSPRAWIAAFVLALGTYQVVTTLYSLAHSYVLTNVGLGLGVWTVINTGIALTVTGVAVLLSIVIVLKLANMIASPDTHSYGLHEYTIISIAAGVATVIATGTAFLDPVLAGTSQPVTVTTTAAVLTAVPHAIVTHEFWKPGTFTSTTTTSTSPTSADTNTNTDANANAHRREPGDDGDRQVGASTTPNPSELSKEELRQATEFTPNFPGANASNPARNPPTHHTNTDANTDTGTGDGTVQGEPHPGAHGAHGANTSAGGRDENGYVTNAEAYIQSQEFEHDWQTETDVSFDDIAGMTELKHELETEVIKPYDERERAEELGISPPNIVFHGPPGTGKTFTAKGLATELGFPFAKLSGADLQSKWINESSDKVKSMFDEAKQLAANTGGAVVFLDELDTVLKKRSGGSGSGHEEDNKVVNEFLNHLEDTSENNIVFVGATNRLDALDDAGIRSGRIDKKIFVGKPDVEARTEVLQKHLDERNHSVPESDVEDIARKTGGLVAADLASLVEKAAFRVFERDGDEINTADLYAAANAIK